MEKIDPAIDFCIESIYDGFSLFRTKIDLD